MGIKIKRLSTQELLRDRQFLLDDIMLLIAAQAIGIDDYGGDLSTPKRYDEACRMVYRIEQELIERNVDLQPTVGVMS